MLEMREEVSQGRRRSETCVGSAFERYQIDHNSFCKAPKVGDGPPLMVDVRREFAGCCGIKNGRAMMK